MSSAQAVQLLITFAGIALAALVFLFGPFEMLGNSLVALAIFIAAGTAAGYAYAKLYARRKD
jgi:positive regulator of sigma E activity